MYLVDTDVLSEARKGARADAGVRAFFDQARDNSTPLFLSVISIGEIRRGIELVRHRGDARKAATLARWLNEVLEQFDDRILSFDADCAQAWGALRVPHPENPVDKQIAATAWVHGLTVATGNPAHFANSGMEVHCPFSERS